MAQPQLPLLPLLVGFSIKAAGLQEHALNVSWSSWTVMWQQVSCSPHVEHQTLFVIKRTKPTMCSRSSFPDFCLPSTVSVCTPPAEFTNVQACKKVSVQLDLLHCGERREKRVLMGKNSCCCADNRTH